MSDTRDHFNQAAADWDQRPFSVQMAEAATTAIRRELVLRSDMDALDFGCGTGLVSLSLAPALRSVLGVDTAEEMLKTLANKAQEQGFSQVSTLRLDVTRETLPLNRFDLVVSSMTFHHVADTAALLQQLSASLRPGGWIAVMDLDSEDGSFHAPTIPGVMHLGFARPALQALFKQAGFSAVRVSTAHQVQRKNTAGELKEYTTFLMVAQKPTQ